MKWKNRETTEKPSAEESMASVMDGLEVVRASVVGYRTKLEADGFSPTMAETMAANLHAILVAKIFGVVE